MEFEIHGTIFSIKSSKYDFVKNGERIAGTSHKVTVLDRETRTVHEVKVSEDALASLDFKEDGPFHGIVNARANGNVMSLTFVSRVAAAAKAS